MKPITLTNPGVISAVTKAGDTTTLVGGAVSRGTWIPCTAPDLAHYGLVVLATDLDNVVPSSLVSTTTDDGGNTVLVNNGKAYYTFSDMIGVNANVKISYRGIRP